MPHPSSILADALRRNDRTALARAITLAESTRHDHQAQAQELMRMLMPHTGNSIRLGITGSPGVGKSTFIEAFGLHVIEKGHQVAVLAVDPTSAITGGSIMGDKTRMTQLSQHPDAFIRPSPAGTMLGGVARRTREAILLCEAAGFDVIIVETVGVGQSETEVANMTDMFVLLLQPGSGDELQGIKRGIVELADLLIVTKADGELLHQAERVRADYAAALRMLTPHGAGGWKPRVQTASALEGKGIAETWEAIGAFRRAAAASGNLARVRAAQARAWLWKELKEMLLERFLEREGLAERIGQMEEEVAAGRLPASHAAQQLLDEAAGA